MMSEDYDAEVRRGIVAQPEYTSPEKETWIRLTSKDVNSLLKQTGIVEQRYSELETAFHVRLLEDKKRPLDNGT